MRHAVRLVFGLLLSLSAACSAPSARPAATPATESAAASEQPQNLGATGCAPAPCGSAVNQLVNSSVPAAKGDTAAPGAAASLTVVVLGTSAAAGMNLGNPNLGGAAGNRPWATLFEEYLNKSHPGSRVINLAHEKMTSFDGMQSASVPPVGYPAPDPERNISAAIARKPDAVIVAYQLAAGAPTAQIIKNLEAMRDAAAQAGVPIWISTPIPRLPEKQAERPQILEAQTAILAAFGARAIDFTTPLSEAPGSARPDLFLGDRHHPNQEGHRLMFQAVVDAKIPDVVSAKAAPELTH